MLRVETTRTASSIRQRLEEFFERPTTNLVILALIVLSVVLTIVEFSEADRVRVSAAGRVNGVIAALFVVELLLRFVAEPRVDGRLGKYFRAWWLDWLAVLPVFLEYAAFPLLRSLRTFRFLRMLRFVRFLRALRFLRVYTAATRFLPDLARRGRFYLAGTLFALFAAVIVGAVLLFVFEEGTGSSVGSDFVQSLMFSVYSLLAGEPIDQSPNLTIGGQFIAMAVVSTGVIVVGIVVGLVSSLTFDYMQRGERKAMIKGAYWEDHVIVCGLGKVGFTVVERLRSERLHVAVIEKVDDSPFTERLERSELVDLLRADALDPGVLTSARIAQARALVACTGSDARNLEIALLARVHAPDVPVVARIVDPVIRDDVGRAIGRELGHPILMADDVAGLFAAALEEAARSVFEVGDSGKSYVYGELRLPAGCGLRDRTPSRIREAFTVNVLMYTCDGRESWEPPPDMEIPGGAIVSVVGPADAFARFREVCEGSAHRQHTAAPRRYQRVRRS